MVTAVVGKIISIDRSRQAHAASTSQAAYDERFAALYETYYPKTFAFIYSRVREVELAKDLVSASFERAYAKGRELRDQSAYGAWLFSIAKNQISGHYRHAQRERANLERAGNELRFVSSPMDPETSVLRDERVGRLMTHLRGMPQRDQELLSLKFDAELKNAEIGDILGMSALSVRVAIFRALRRLRARMETNEAA